MFGCAGPRLTVQERALLRDADPFGFILFKRNCETREQVRALINDLRAATGREDIVIAIDQEGGRVSRLQPPEWPKYPSARTFGLMYERDPDWGLEAISAYARLVAHELAGLGVIINCAPVVDLYNPEGTPAIGDRAFSSRPGIVAALARPLIETFMANGVLPVIKHLPGHGRLALDPHELLPTIDAPRGELETLDFMPFELLKDAPLGMNSHALFTALDPANPVSLSPVITRDVIRGTLGFDGLLLSDDLTMKALKGNAADLARRAIAAGNDVALHCSGDVSEMQAICMALEPMSDDSWARWGHARAMLGRGAADYDAAADAARLDVLLGGLAVFDAVG
ncbi:MAG: beta-N-acetylhexosaminidase [Alphaproteobacteria bacterium]|nr:beta-N-acetylhexosaminidase [Alphaproteobacteria bacterium]